MIILAAQDWVSIVSAIGTLLAAIAAAVAAGIAAYTAHQNRVTAEASLKSAAATEKAAEANARTADLMSQQLEQQVREREESERRHREATYPNIAVSVEGGYHESTKRHAVFMIKLKNQHATATAERVRTSLALENPNGEGDWRELHPAIYLKNWEDMTPQGTNYGTQGFTFPESREIHSRPVEDFIDQWFPGLLGTINLTYPTNADYYIVERPFKINVRFVLTYRPAVDGAKEERIERFYILEPQCDVRENRPAEVEHPEIVTRWTLKSKDA